MLQKLGLVDSRANDYGRNAVSVAQMPGRMPFTLAMTIFQPTENMRLAVRAKCRHSDDDLELLVELLTCFVSSANSGMFSGHPFKPENALARIGFLSTRTVGELQCLVELHSVATTAIKVLVGMIVQSHFGHVPLSEVELSTLPKVGQPFEPKDLLGGRYPERTQHIPYPVYLSEDLESVTMPAIRLEFARSLDTEEFEKVEQLIADWHCLILLGGYLDSFEQMSELPMRPSNTYLAAPNVVEHVLYDYSGTTAVYDALLNMTSKLHASFCPISRVEIE